MSYLDPVTIVFSGDFQSDVSTVNNDVRHYDNKTFERRFQKPPQTVTGPDGKPVTIENGWWNPDGGATFNFVNCKVTRCIVPGADEYAQGDIIGAVVSGPVDRSAGKMVDLDPQMQFTSELWGVGITITNMEGRLLFSGDLHATGFRDAQQRQFPTSATDKSFNVNGQTLGGNWITTIENITWGDIDEVAPLKLLKESTDDNRLSLSLSAFGYFYTHQLGRFSMGKIIGVIGPWKKNDPVRFAPARRVYGTIPNIFQYSNFAINRNILTLDLGMSFPVQDPLGTPLSSFKSLVIALSKGRIDIPLSTKDPVSLSLDTYETIGTVNIPADPQWLLQSGGIVNFLLDDSLQKLVADYQLLILRELNGKMIVYGREAVDGWYMRCDQNVLRIDPGDTLESDFYVYQWGQPASNVTVSIALQPQQSGGGGGSNKDPAPPKAAIPDINFPADAMQVSGNFKTDQYGRSTVRFTGSDPENPRKYLDGQLYLYTYSIEGINNLEQYFNDTVMVHLRDAFNLPSQPTWEDIRDIFLQFGNLYPVMSRHVVDMSVMEDIIAKKNILLFAFSRDINDPLYMPVTRDLSVNKLRAIVKWLNNPLPAPDAGEEKLLHSDSGQEYRSAEAVLTDESYLSKASRAKGGDLSMLSQLFNNTPLELL